MPSPASYPFAVRLIGFPTDQGALIDQYFGRPRAAGYRYIALAEDNLQDPDLF